MSMGPRIEKGRCRAYRWVGGCFILWACVWSFLDGLDRKGYVLRFKVPAWGLRVVEGCLISSFHILEPKVQRGLGVQGVESGDQNPKPIQGIPSS